LRLKRLPQEQVTAIGTARLREGDAND
jgi:hypothetical protein